MAAVQIIGQLSFLILLIGAYLTAAMPTGNEVDTSQPTTNQRLQQLQDAMNLTRNIFNARRNDSDLLCNLVVLHKFSKKVNESLVCSTATVLLWQNIIATHIYISFLQPTGSSMDEEDLIRKLSNRFETIFDTITTLSGVSSRLNMTVNIYSYRSL